MGVLKNPKWERFAQGLASGKTADEAYVFAGYEENRGNAIRLKANERISARLKELQERAAIRAEVTSASLIEMADEIRRAAFNAGQFAPAVSAVKEMGILAGVRVEKRDTINRRADDLSDDELANIARSGGANPVEAALGSGKPH